MSSRLSASRKKFLVEKNRAFLAAQPRLRLLRRRLLAIGGHEVVLQRERHLEQQLARAQVWKRVTPRKIAGAGNQCHVNSASAYLKAPTKTQIVSGWALHSDDVVWRQHSWVLRGETLCETTVPAKIYVGVILDPEESVQFVRAELGESSAAKLPPIEALVTSATRSASRSKQTKRKR